ncbi:MAG: hypothetical protein AAGD28_01950 [Bacteroidota bacterium]
MILLTFFIFLIQNLNRPIEHLKNQVIKANPNPFPAFFHKLRENGSEIILRYWDEEIKAYYNLGLDEIQVGPQKLGGVLKQVPEVFWGAVVIYVFDPVKTGPVHLDYQQIEYVDHFFEQ